MNRENANLPKSPSILKQSPTIEKQRSIEQRNSPEAWKPKLHNDQKKIFSWRKNTLPAKESRVYFRDEVASSLELPGTIVDDSKQIKILD
jgi:hypothetical protein